MGRYITPTLLRELLPGSWIEEYLRTDPVVEGGTGRITGYQPATDAQLEAFIVSAENEADSYLGVRYTLPLPTVPDVLRQAVADICRYRISADNPTNSIRTRYQDALLWLGKVARGSASLGIVFADQKPTTMATAISRPGQRQLTREKLRAWGL